MFSKFAITAATILVLISSVLVSVNAASGAEHHPSWDEYKKLYNKKYSSPAEDAKRQAIYQANMQRATQLMKVNPHAKFGHNEFADQSAEEFKVMHNADGYFKNFALKTRFQNRTTFTEKQNLQRPETVDWRSKGAVTYVKNQGQCGSCWSFSTTGNIEGQWFLAGHTLVALSEQELVSCDHTCNGCQGGLMDDAFEWIIQERGGWITGETDYPYVSGAGQVPTCSMSGKPKVAQITGYHNYEHSESAMATALAANGPISIGVDASSWQTYTGGIMTDCQSTSVDHGVLIVGYDLSYTTPYWIIKNSWTANWGEQGYIRVEYGTDQCLITSAPSSSKASSGPAPPPGPPGPSPPTPPTPPSPPSGGTFTQYQCENFLCLGDCKGHTFPQGQCLQMTGGGSAIAECTTSTLRLTVFSESGDCQGASQTESQPLDQCLKDESGTYIYNKCSTGSSSSSSSEGARVRNAKIAGADAKVHKLKKM